MMRSSTLALLLLLGALGCSDDDGPLDAGEAGPADVGADATLDAEPDSDVTDAGVIWIPGPMEWADCTLPGPVAGECVNIDVPRDWDEPDGATLLVHLARVVSPSSRGQLWLLAGGPGQAGSSLAEVADLFPDFDLYLLDFRGTGASSYMDCDTELFRDDYEGCAERSPANGVLLSSTFLRRRRLATSGC